jgi:hypothetical protein
LYFAALAVGEIARRAVKINLDGGKPPKDGFYE